MEALENDSQGDILDKRSFQYLTKSLLKMGKSTITKQTNTVPTASNPVPSKQSFRNQCWTQFEKYAEDGNKMEIHSANLSQAILELSKRMSSSRITSIISNQCYEPNKCLNWNEFYDLCQIIVADYKQERTKACDRSISSTSTSTTAFQDPFQTMVKAQSSSVQTSSSNAVANKIDMTHSVSEKSTVSKNNIKMSGKLKDAVCEATKRSNRKMRRIQKFSAASSKKPHYIKPLEKQSVMELVEPEENLTTRRSKIQEKREAENNSLKQLQNKRGIFMELNRLVINCDRVAIDRAVREDEARAMQAKVDNWTECREKEKITEDNIASWRRNDLAIKAEEASTLKYALSSSSSLSKSMLECEKLEKSTLKESRITRLSEYTSYDVMIPEVIQHKIRSAKRLSDYESAKKQADDLMYSTISQRIAQHALARRSAILSAKASGGLVNVAPLRGEDYFNDSDNDDDDDVDVRQLAPSSASMFSLSLGSAARRTREQGFPMALSSSFKASRS